MNRNGIIRSFISAAAIVAIASSSVSAGGGSPIGQATRSSRTTALESTATCTSGTRSCPIRITFASGAYSGQGNSTLAGIASEKWFVVRGSAGQTMVVVVKGAGPTRGVVYFPDGSHSGQPGGRVFDGILAASGDYKIRVTESSMGEGWSGRVDVVVLIY